MRPKIKLFMSQVRKPRVLVRNPLAEAQLVEDGSCTQCLLCLSVSRAIGSTCDTCNYRGLLASMSPLVTPTRFTLFVGLDIEILRL